MNDPAINKKSLEKQPPHDVEMEQAVLGAILLDNHALYKALDIIAADDLYRPGHQKIFRAMYDILARGDVIDLLMLRDELERRGQMDDVGVAYICALVDQVPTAANIQYHAGKVREMALKRTLLNACLEASSNVYDDSLPFSELFPAFSKQVDDLRQAATGKFFDWVKTKEYQPIDYKEAAYVDWLASLGFRRFPLKSGSLFLQVEQEHILTETRWTKAICETVKDTVREATKDAPGVYDMLIGNGAKPFSHIPLTGLPCVTLADLLHDTKDCCRLFWQNGCVETTTANGARFFPYSELPGHIWKDAIVPREYHGRHNGVENDAKSDFEQVITYITTEILTDDAGTVTTKPNAQNKKVCEHGLFRLIHTWNDPVNPVSTIFIDNNPNKDFNDGGRGKGLLINGVYHIRSNGSTDGVVIVEDGRSFAGNFKFQRVAPNTQTLILDDVDESKVSIKDFYAWLTGTAVIEGKGRTKFAFTPEYAPKIGFTSNRPFFSHDLSSARRIIIVPLTDYFQRQGCHPMELFKGRRLFYEWDQTEWARFDDYFLRIIAENIRIPALEIPQPDLTVFNQYRMMMEIDESLLHLFDALAINTDCQVDALKEELSEQTGKEWKDADIYKAAEIYCRMKKLTLKKNKDGMRYRKNSKNYLHFESPELLKKMERKNDHKI